jgi:hypothetical protein
VAEGCGKLSQEIDICYLSRNWKKNLNGFFNRKENKNLMPSSLIS